MYDDGSGLNYSPMRGMTGIRFLRHPEDFQSVVGEILRDQEPVRVVEKDLLFIDQDLHRWRAHLGVEASGGGCVDEGMSG